MAWHIPAPVSPPFCLNEDNSFAVYLQFCTCRICLLNLHSAHFSISPPARPIYPCPFARPSYESPSDWDTREKSDLLSVIGLWQGHKGKEWSVVRHRPLASRLVGSREKDEEGAPSDASYYRMIEGHGFLPLHQMHSSCIIWFNSVFIKCIIAQHKLKQIKIKIQIKLN